MTKDELLIYLAEWTEGYRLDKCWDKRLEDGYQQIVAILKNQPTITKKDIECWASEAWDRIETREGGIAGKIEDIMKEMLDDIGVSITVDPRQQLDTNGKIKQ